MPLDCLTRSAHRNRFVAGPGHDDYENWLDMQQKGYAVRRDGRTLPFGGDDLFCLTLLGAKIAITSREKLDTEDFPS